MTSKSHRRNYRLRTRWDPLTCYTCGVTTPSPPPNRTWDQFWWLEWTCCACGRHNIPPPVYNPKTYYVTVAMEKHPVLPIAFCLLGVGVGLLLVSGVLPDPLVHSKPSPLITFPSIPLVRGLGWFLIVGYVAMLVFMGIKIARGTWKSFCVRLTSRFTAE